MTIHAPESLRTKNRRLDRRLAEINGVAAAMRAGAVLHFTYRPTAQWVLSTGAAVTDAVARVLIANPNIIGVGDALFDGTPSQTYRWAEPTCCGS
jgi:hypothetical protein